MSKSALMVGCALVATLMGFDAAKAQGAQPAATALDEVVVTATRREESLRDVPIAISAFGAERMKSTRIESIADLSIGTPGLNTASAGVGVTPFLRGVGQPTTTPGGESPIAMYIDGVYQPMLLTNDVPFNNVERVEVLKGPQGTLFGRNATGGMINVITRTPSETFGGNFSASYGNFQTTTLKGYIEGGLTEGVAADLALYYQDRAGGWGRNYDSPTGRFGPAGKKIGVAEDFAARTKIVAKPTDDLTLTLTGDYRNAKTSYGYNYNVDGRVGQDGLPPLPGYYDVVVTPGRAMDVKPLVWGLSGKLAYDAGAFTVTSLTSYQKVRIRIMLDNDLITQDLVSAHEIGVSNTLQQEIQFASNGSGPFHWIGGLYFLDMESGFGGTHGLQLTGAGVGVTAPTAIDIRNTIKTKSYAVFAEVGYDLTEQTKLTLGARYTWDKRNIVGRTQLDAAFTGYSPIATLATADFRTKFSDPTYRAILDHHFTPDVMAYASYSHGFKSGNFNTVAPTDPPYNPEELDAFEVGFKAQSSDGRYSLNGAAFYYDYSNLQFEVNTGVSTRTQNATSAKIKGLELDGAVRPVENLTLRAGYAYVDGEYSNFKNGSCYTPNPTFNAATPGSTVNLPVVCDASGTPIIRTPKHQFNASVNYVVPVSVGDVDISVAYQTQSTTRYDLAGRLTQKPFHMVNGSVVLKAANGLSIGAFAKNLLNEKYSNYKIEQAFGDYYTAAMPRTWGVEVGYKF